MSKLFAIVGLLVCIQLAAGGVVRRDAPVATAVPTFAEIADKVQAGLKEANDEFLKFFGFQNNDQVVEKIKTETQTFANTVKGQLDEIEKTVNSEKNKKLVEDIKKQVTDLVENANINTDAKALNEQFQTSLQKITRETQKFAQKLQGEGKEISADTEKLFKSVYDSTLDAAKKVTEEVKKNQ